MRTKRDAQIAQKHAQKEIKTGSIVLTSGTGIYWIFYFIGLLFHFYCCFKYYSVLLNVIYCHCISLIPVKDVLQLILKSHTFLSLLTSSVTV